MADRPARPGKHAARHRAPRAAARLRTHVATHLPMLSLPRAVRLTRPGLAVGAVTGLMATAVVGAQLLGGGATDEAKADEKAVTSALNYRTSTLDQDTVSRSADRPSLTALKAESLSGGGGASGRHAGPTKVATGEIAFADMDPRDIARAMLVPYGWSETEFGCLDSLWVGESDWDPFAENPSSGAYGIPQSLPAEKMASAGSDWRTNPATQIEWGLDYIRSSYGTPCSADSFKQANGWY